MELLACFGTSVKRLLIIQKSMVAVYEVLNMSEETGQAMFMLMVSVSASDHFLKFTYVVLFIHICPQIHFIEGSVLSIVFTFEKPQPASQIAEIKNLRGSFS